MFSSPIAEPSSQEVPQERAEPGEAVFAVYVVLNDVECKIVETAETPHADGKKTGRTQRWVLGKKDDGRQDTTYQEKRPFCVDESWVFDVRHGILHE